MFEYRRPDTYNKSMTIHVFCESNVYVCICVCMCANVKLVVGERANRQTYTNKTQIINEIQCDRRSYWISAYFDLGCDFAL